MSRAGIGASRSAMHGGGFVASIGILGVLALLGWLFEPREFWNDWKEDRRINKLIKEGKF